LRWRCSRPMVRRSVAIPSAEPDSTGIGASSAAVSAFMVSWPYGASGSEKCSTWVGCAGSNWRAQVGSCRPPCDSVARPPAAAAVFRPHPRATIASPARSSGRCCGRSRRSRVQAAHHLPSGCRVRVTEVIRVPLRRIATTFGRLMVTELMGIERWRIGPIGGSPRRRGLSRDPRLSAVWRSGDRPFVSKRATRCRPARTFCRAVAGPRRAQAATREPSSTDQPVRILLHAARRLRDFGGVTRSTAVLEQSRLAADRAQWPARPAAGPVAAAPPRQ
jgi:hypothetical protein